MKANLKCRLAVMSLFAFSAWAHAEPVTLDAAVMDRVTAGSQPVLERLAQILAAVPGNAGGLLSGDLLPLLGAEQFALFTALASGEQIAFHLLAPGELAATHPLPSGDQLVLVKQLSPAETASMNASNAGGPVQTYFLNPGESLHLQQTSANGTNYLYVYSSGNSTVTTSQRNGL